MEAAALYTYARSAGVRVLCLAHVTNTTGQAGDDFEKDDADRTRECQRGKPRGDKAEPAYPLFFGLRCHAIHRFRRSSKEVVFHPCFLGSLPYLE